MNVSYALALTGVLGIALATLGCGQQHTETAASSSTPDTATASVAVFDWFEYQGRDPVFATPLPEGQFQNPILAGFYPDPSITRAGDYYYMVHSSFAFFPGIPIFRSQDLVHWESLGHVLTRPEQLPLVQQGVSRGIYAPTIRHHDGVFYVITTLVDIRGNFIVTATDPAGPWSDPILLPEVGGIDPDIFFDDDGRIYIAHNDAPEGEPLYDGHRAIRLWEYDPVAQKVKPESGRIIVNGGADISQKPIWIEAPHIYKIDGWYYLTCAEGGTGYGHSQVIFRTRSLDEPFIPWEKNPILTQRDLPRDRANPITSAGHADLILTPEGEWWAVFLATRAYDEVYYNTGRETFLLPVSWQDGWPVILPAGEEIPYRPTIPASPGNTLDTEPLTGNFRWREEFTRAALSHHWNRLRSEPDDWYRIDKGQLHLTPRPLSMADPEQPSFIGRRQQHTHYSASTRMEIPQASGYSAGLVVFQNETHHYYLGLETAAQGTRLFIEQANKGAPGEIFNLSLPDDAGNHLVLGVEGDAGLISFYYRNQAGEQRWLLRDADARLLSTEIAGGFVGSHIGLHARSTHPQ